MTKHAAVSTLALSLLAALATAAAASPASFRDDYAAAARAEDRTYAPSADRGKTLYTTERVGTGGERLACAACHTPDPRRAGKTRAGKAIEPLAPAANPARFTDLAKTEKWFRRNCGDVLGRACTPAEKADFITYLMTIR